MRISHLVLAIAALAASAPAAGQELQAGTRVRISAPIIRANSRFTGTVMSTENGRVLLRLDPTVQQDTRLDTISIPRNLIRRVEVSLGQSTGRSRGPAARTGAMAGVIAGIAIGLAVGGGSKSANEPARNPWTTALWLGPALGVAGAGVGALIGEPAHERWQIAPTTAPAAGLAPRRGVRLGVSFGV